MWGFVFVCINLNSSYSENNTLTNTSSLLNVADLRNVSSHDAFNTWSALLRSDLLGRLLLVAVYCFHMKTLICIFTITPHQIPIVGEGTGMEFVFVCFFFFLSFLIYVSHKCISASRLNECEVHVATLVSDR